MPGSYGFAAVASIVYYARMIHKLADAHFALFVSVGYQVKIEDDEVKIGWIAKG
jgi:hypothetical protein